MRNTITILILYTLTGFFSGSSYMNLLAQSNGRTENRIFVVYNTGEEQQEFKAYAAQMARLKSFGRVEAQHSPAARSASFTRRYPRIEATSIGGVSRMVTARLTSRPRSGLVGLSSAKTTWVMPTLYPAKPRIRGSAAWLGQWRTRPVT